MRAERVGLDGSKALRFFFLMWRGFQTLHFARRGRDPYVPPIPAEFSNWPDEQHAWRETVALMDQSYHLTVPYVQGPDVRRLVSHLGVNTFANFGRNKAKQFVACNHDGFVIGDMILFGLEDDR